MSYYAKILNNKVIETIKATEEFINQYIDSTPGEWIKIEKNEASIDYVYNKQTKIFSPPKPYDSWILDSNLNTWNPPIEMPINENDEYVWNEETQTWDLVSNE